MSRNLLFLLLLCVVIGLGQNRARIEHWLFPPPPRADGPAEVVLYATEWCGYCAKTRSFFRDHGIVYEERDIEKSAAAAAEHRKLQPGGGVPVVVVNGETVIRGYDPELLQEALGL